MGIKIIKKDISWLTDKVADFDIFLESQSYYFKNNGYLAGGFFVFLYCDPVFFYVFDFHFFPYFMKLF